MEYITPAKCEENRNEIYKKVELNKDEITVLKTTVKLLLGFISVIGSALVVGVVSILVILLTRGI